MTVQPTRSRRRAVSDCRRFTLTLMAFVILTFSGTLVHAQQFETWKDDRPTKAPVRRAPAAGV